LNLTLKSLVITELNPNPVLCKQIETYDWRMPIKEPHFSQRLLNLMEVIPLCDIIEVYIHIYLRLYTTIFHNSE